MIFDLFEAWEHRVEVVHWKGLTYVLQIKQSVPGRNMTFVRAKTNNLSLLANLVEQLYCFYKNALPKGET